MQIHDGISSQFPRPTRPINSYNFEIPQCFPELDSMNKINFKSSLPVEKYDDYQAEAASGDQEEKKETLDEVLELKAKWYEKLPASIRSQLNLRILKDTSDKLKGFKVDSTTTRGGNGPLEEMKQKLERFKIRTVQQGGVVQVDEEEKR